MRSAYKTITFLAALFIWAAFAYPSLASCGGPSECTAEQAPPSTPEAIEDQEWQARAIAAWKVLEENYEAQRKLARWLDAEGENPGIAHERVLENNLLSFKTYLGAKCIQNPDDVPTTARCLIEQTEERIHALQNPEGTDYIWLK